MAKKMPCRLACINIQHLPGRNWLEPGWLSGNPIQHGSGSCASKTALSQQFIMKNIIGFTALLLLASVGHAQGQSAAVEAKPKHPRAMQYNERQLYESEQAKKRRVLVRCRDGSRHIAKVCRRHGGVA